ncbi:hypothetical protein [Luteimonas sp. 3794]|uniref:hypothetical protein n=1 Tax=Luteimonas sp. 3794 TaxID=2817730 RepID=UPI00285DA0EF|nr:hypothetical protein [Luteimonas sp. 3794]MDR6990120.1 hypothetical protein [Luteimonas sp. 3794]
MIAPRPVRWWRIGALCAALMLCLWVGWHDFDPWIARDEVREAIRLTIRRSVQIAVQFVAPGALLALLARELGPGLRTKGRST